MIELNCRIVTVMENGKIAILSKNTPPLVEIGRGTKTLPCKFAGNHGGNRRDLAFVLVIGSGDAVKCGCHVLDSPSQIRLHDGTAQPCHKLVENDSAT